MSNAMTRQTLLPPNHTAFEEAVDLTGARIDELPVDTAKLVRPWEISVSHLPWLALGLSVDLWEPEWSEERYRTLTARSLPMHARKGTQASIAEHIRIMGADPRRFIVPPAKTFLMEALTGEEREAFLARFPQLRIYPFVARGTYRFAHFTSAAFGREKAFLDACCVKDVGAWSRFIRTARLWDRGAETTLTIRAVTPEAMGRFHAATFDEVVLGAKPTSALHLDAPPTAKAFLVDDFGVARTSADVREPQLLQECPDIPLMKVHTEPLLDRHLKVDTPPAHHTVGLSVGAGVNEGRQFALLLQ
jgi:hypothetical protein